MLEQGKVVEVGIVSAGDELVGDHLAGATVLQLDDVSDFDEGGGRLTIDGVLYKYLSSDDDASTVTIDGGLESDASDETKVLVYPYSEEKWAKVIIEEGDDSISARIPMFLADDVQDGVRYEEDQESCVVELEKTEWVVRDILGRPEDSPSIPKWEDDDGRAITAGEVTAGEAVLSLTYKPIKESLSCVLAGSPQRSTAWTINYEEQTLTVPLSGWEEPGDILWVQYAYLRGQETAPPKQEWELILSDTITFSQPGLQTQDTSLVGAAPQWKDSSDATYLRINGNYNGGDPSFKGFGNDAIVEPVAVPVSEGDVKIFVAMRVSGDAILRYPKINLGNLNGLDATPMPGAPTWIEMEVDGTPSDRQWLLDNPRNFAFGITTTHFSSLGLSGPVGNFYMNVYEVRAFVREV